MSSHAAHGASLVAAAVQAAIREGAPRRTVAAVAAAAVGALASATARTTATARDARTQDAPSPTADANDPAQLLEKLRAVRRAQRKRKSENKRHRRQAKQAASDALTSPIDPHSPPATDSCLLSGAAGRRTGTEGNPDAAPAQAPERLAAELAPSNGASPNPCRQPPPSDGLRDESHGDTSEASGTMRRASSASGTMRSGQFLGYQGSEAPSAGNVRVEPYPAATSNGGKSRGRQK